MVVFVARRNVMLALGSMFLVLVILVIILHTVLMVAVVCSILDCWRLDSSSVWGCLGGAFIMRGGQPFSSQNHIIT